jgi:hypothetical protein
MPTNTGYSPLNTSQMDSSKLTPFVKGFSNTFTLSGTSSFTFTPDVNNDLIITGSTAIVKNSIFQDTITINVLDTISGTYTGIPNHLINTIMYNFQVHDFPTIQFDHLASYPVRIPAGIQIQVNYTNQSGGSDPPMMNLNLYLHKILV